MSRQKLPVPFVLIFFSLFALCCTQRRYNSESDFTTEVSPNDTVVILKYDGKSKDVRIPPKIKGLPVTAIWRGAFLDKELTGIAIPETIVSLYAGTFTRNAGLVKITIGDDVDLIGGYAFTAEFDQFYTWGVDKRGGTYIFSNNHWGPEDKSIPVLTFSSNMTAELSDISFLLDMPDLEDVYLGNSNLLTDITPLSGLAKLTKLKIYDCPNIKSLEPLSLLTNLKSLHLYYINNDYEALDISPLANLPNLTEVYLTGNKIKNISPMLQSDSIKYIGVFADEVEAGISGELAAQFAQKNINLDIFSRDTR